MKINGLCNGCKWNYTILNVEAETEDRLDRIFPDQCYSCSRNQPKSNIGIFFTDNYESEDND